MAWTIKGEAGKTLDATVRSFEEIRGEEWGLQFQSLDSDTLTWTAATDNATGAGAIIPDAGQVVELFADGERKFRGHVAMPRVGLKSVVVEAVGPWWWMERITLASGQPDGTGAYAERTSFVFPTQDLAVSVAALIDAAIAAGVPMTRGAIDVMYAAPKMTLANMSFAAALGEILRWVPDAVAWFDYSGASGTLPALRISRRGAMPEKTWTVGSDPVETAELNPRLDLEVSRTELNYVSRRAGDGRPQWAVQGDGAAVAGKRQILTVSGPEIVDFLPKDSFESVAVYSFPWTNITADYVIALDSDLNAIAQTYGTPPGGPANYFDFYSGSSSAKSFNRRTVPALTRRPKNGETLPATHAYLMFSSAPLPDWALRYLNAIEVVVTGTWVAAWRDSAVGVGTPWSAAYMAVQDGGAQSNSMYENAGIYPNYGWDFRVDYAWRPFSCPAYAVGFHSPGWTTVYKPWDYDYITPPAGLAANLRAAQAWVPWEGPIGLVGDDVDAANWLAHKHHLAGAYPACATMGALAKRVRYEGGRKRTVIDLGAPPRTDFGSLVSRIRREPKDNIVYL